MNEQNDKREEETIAFFFFLFGSLWKLFQVEWFWWLLVVFGS